MVKTVHPDTYTTTDADAAVPGSELELWQNGQSSVAFLLKETGGVNGVTAKLQGRLFSGAWLDVTARDETATPHGAAEVAVGAGGEDYLFVPDDPANEVWQLFTEFRIVARSTVAGNAGDLKVDGIAK